MVLTLNTLTDELSAMFGGPMDGISTLSDLFRYLDERARSSHYFDLAHDSPIWMELSDGTHSRSVIHEDKKTYHQGHLLETFGSLNGAADIEMGKDYTQLELTFKDAEDNNWEVSTCWGRMPTGALTCYVEGVMCPSKCFEYIHDQYPTQWAPGDNPCALKSVLRVFL